MLQVFAIQTLVMHSFVVQNIPISNSQLQTFPMNLVALYDSLVHIFFEVLSSGAGSCGTPYSDTYSFDPHIDFTRAPHGSIIEGFRGYSCRHIYRDRTLRIDALPHVSRASKSIEICGG